MLLETSVNAVAPRLASLRFIILRSPFSASIISGRYPGDWVQEQQSIYLGIYFPFAKSNYTQLIGNRLPEHLHRPSGGIPCILPAVSSSQTLQGPGFSDGCVIHSGNGLLLYQNAIFILCICLIDHAAFEARSNGGKGILMICSSSKDPLTKRQIPAVNLLQRRAPYPLLRPFFYGKIQGFSMSQCCADIYLAALSVFLHLKLLGLRRVHDQGKQISAQQTALSASPCFWRQNSAESALPPFFGIFAAKSSGQVCWNCLPLMIDVQQSVVKALSEMPRCRVIIGIITTWPEMEHERVLLA